MDQPDTLIAFAGDDFELASGTLVTLGSDPVASGGAGPYQYEGSDGTTIFSTEPNPGITLLDSY